MRESLRFGTNTWLCVPVLMGMLVVVGCGHAGQTEPQSTCVITQDDIRASHYALLEAQARFWAMLTAASVEPGVMFGDSDVAREELAKVEQVDGVDFVLLQTDSFRVSSIGYGDLVASFPLRSEPHLFRGDEIVVSHPLIDDSRRREQIGQVVLGFRAQSSEVGSQEALDKALGEFASNVAKIMASQVRPAFEFDDPDGARERLELVGDNAYLHVAQVQSRDGGEWVRMGRGDLDYPMQTKPTLKIENSKAVASHPIMGESEQLGQVVVVLGYTFVEE